MTMHAPNFIIRPGAHDEMLPGGAVFDPMRRARGMVTSLDERVTKDLLHILHQHYAGHRWVVEVKTEQGVAFVRNLFAHPHYGFVIHLRNCLSPADIKAVAIESGGELLERFGLPRGPFDLHHYDNIWRKDAPGVPKMLRTTDTVLR
jgi:hypothetical protein